MRKRNKFSENDLTNMSRGQGAPPQREHLEKLRGMAKDLQNEIEKEQGISQSQELDKEKEPSKLRDLFKGKKSRNRERDDFSR